jgi:hypothetical protein
MIVTMKERPLAGDTPATFGRGQKPPPPSGSSFKRMPLRKLLPIALLLAAVSIRCTGTPAEPAPVGQVAVTVTTTTTSTIPIAPVNPGTIQVIPSGIVLASATLVSFQSLIAPSGGVPPYTFAWTFGDGEAGAGPTPGHVYQTTGDFLVRLTVTDSKGDSGLTTAQVKIRSVTGRWTATFSGGTPPLLPQNIDLLQNQTAVTATINDTANLVGFGSGTGSVANPRALSISVTFPAGTPSPTGPPTPFAATYIGTIDEALTTWSGTVTGYPGCPCTFTATRPNAGSAVSTRH